MKQQTKYLNQFHKESEERKAKKLAAQKPIPGAEASRIAFEMHREMINFP